MRECHLVLQSTHRGLSNKSGENNCFLNGVLQILWHNKTFRKCLLSIQHHVCQETLAAAASQQLSTEGGGGGGSSNSNSGGSCVYCQLKNLFLEYQFSDSAQIPSTALRKTLAIIYRPELKFQLNSMDDAAECLEAILQRLHADLVVVTSTAGTGDQRKPKAGVDDRVDRVDSSLSSSSSQRKEGWSICNPSCIAHNIFGMNVLEQSVCGCGSMTEPLYYSTFCAVLQRSRG